MSDSLGTFELCALGKDLHAYELRYYVQRPVQCTVSPPPQLYSCKYTADIQGTQLSSYTIHRRFPCRNFVRSVDEGATRLTNTVLPKRKRVLPPPHD